MAVETVVFAADGITDVDSIQQAGDVRP